MLARTILPAHAMRGSRPTRPNRAMSVLTVLVVTLLVSVCGESSPYFPRVITASHRTDGSEHNLTAGTYSVSLRSFDNKVGRHPVTGATYYCNATVNLVEIADMNGNRRSSTEFQWRFNNNPYRDGGLDRMTSHYISQSARIGTLNTISIPADGRYRISGKAAPQCTFRVEISR